VIYIE